MACADDAAIWEPRPLSPNHEHISMDDFKTKSAGGFLPRGQKSELAAGNSSPEIIAAEIGDTQIQRQFAKAGVFGGVCGIDKIN